MPALLRGVKVRRARRLLSRAPKVENDQRASLVVGSRTGGKLLFSLDTRRNIQELEAPASPAQDASQTPDA
jgi:hypothetical protein